MAVKPRVSEIGNAYGQLRVLAQALDSRIAAWICVCSCGEFKIVAGNKLRSGHTQSCGCLRYTNRHRVHGHAASSRSDASKTYSVWATMLARCRNETSSSYASYGAIGITVCPRWEDFKNFLEDMGEAPEGLTIDRIDNSKGYCKDNCRWADRTTQARNRRSVILITHDGQTKCLAEWCSDLNLNYMRTYHKVRTLGLTIAEVLIMENKVRKEDM